MGLSIYQARFMVEKLLGVNFVVFASGFRMMELVGSRLSEPCFVGVLCVPVARLEYIIGLRLFYVGCRSFGAGNRRGLCYCTC